MTNLSLFRLRFTGVQQSPSIGTVRALTAAECERFEAAAGHLHDFEQTRDLLHFVTANLSDVRREVDRFESTAVSMRRSALSEAVEERRTLQRVVINFLGAMRLFLDHRQTHLDRRYGSTSRELLAFNTSRQLQHAQVPAYAFVYELRNFVQHCGMPLQVMRANQRLMTHGEEERIEADVFVGFDRDMLLTLFGNWKYAREFVKAQPGEFAVLPLLETMVGCLETIETDTVAAIMKTLWDDGRFVTTILGEGCDEHSIGLVATTLPTDGIAEQFTWSLRQPPLSILSWLQLITLTPEAPGYRVNRVALAVADPPTIHAR